MKDAIVGFVVSALRAFVRGDGAGLCVSVAPPPPPPENDPLGAMGSP